jgi:hypothetical protein
VKGLNYGIITLLQILKPRASDSPISRNTIKIKDTYMASRKVKLESGNICRFWSGPLVFLLLFESFPLAFGVSMSKSAMCSILLEENELFF